MEQMHKMKESCLPTELRIKELGNKNMELNQNVRRCEQRIKDLQKDCSEKVSLFLTLLTRLVALTCTLPLGFRKNVNPPQQSKRVNSCFLLILKVFVVFLTIERQSEQSSNVVGKEREEVEENTKQRFFCCQRKLIGQYTCFVCIVHHISQEFTK